MLVVLADPAAPAGQQDRAHRRDQQQKRRPLEHQQKARQQQFADIRGRAVGVPARLIGRPVFRDGLQAGAQQRDQQLDQQRSTEHRRAQAQVRAGRPAPAHPLADLDDAVPLVAPADVRHDEHVQDHHRPRVNHHLDGRHEFGAQQQEQHRQRQQVRRPARARRRTDRAAPPRRPRRRSRRSPAMKKNRELILPTSCRRF